MGTLDLTDRQRALLNFRGEVKVASCAKVLRFLSISLPFVFSSAFSFPPMWKSNAERNAVQSVSKGQQCTWKTTDLSILLLIWWPGSFLTFTCPTHSVGQDTSLITGCVLYRTVRSKTWAFKSLIKRDPLFTLFLWHKFALLFMNKIPSALTLRIPYFHFIETCLQTDRLHYSNIQVSKQARDRGLKHSATRVNIYSC